MQLLYIGLVVWTVAFLFLLWHAHLAGSSPRAALSGVGVSWAYLWVFLISTIGPFERRDDQTALMTEGLSTTNKFQVAVIALGLLWALILLVSRRVRFSSLFAGPGFWISNLIILNALSSSWSVWPQLTAYRTLELTTVWIVTCHIFGGERFYNRIDRFLLWTVVIYWISGLLQPGGDAFSGRYVVGAIRQNTGSAIAAAFLIWTVYRASRLGWKRHAGRFLLGLGSLIIFGSLASALALAFAVLVFPLAGSGYRLKTVAFCAVATVGIIYGVLTAERGMPSLVPAVIDVAGKASEKSYEAITTLDGRIPLWTAIWDATKGRPWGAGYAAAERTFEADATGLGWAPSNAHSGYVSGWFGAGWAGVIAVLLVFWSIWSRRRRLPLEVQPVVTALIVFLAINNAFIPGVGGRSNPVFILMMALACIPTPAGTETKRRPLGG